MRKKIDAYYLTILLDKIQRRITYLVSVSSKFPVYQEIHCLCYYRQQIWDIQSEIKKGTKYADLIVHIEDLEKDFRNRLEENRAVKELKQDYYAEIFIQIYEYYILLLSLVTK